MNTTNLHPEFENDNELVSLNRYLSKVSKSIVVSTPNLVTKNEQTSIPSPFITFLKTHKIATLAFSIVLLVGVSTSTLVIRSNQKVSDTGAVAGPELATPTMISKESGIIVESQIVNSSAASVVGQLVDSTIDDLLAEDNEALVTIDTLSNAAVDSVINQVTQSITYEI
jgi:hypothetical protein